MRRVFVGCLLATATPTSCIPSLLLLLLPQLPPHTHTPHTQTGVFAEGGLRDYLAYVRSSSSYSSRFVEASFEWREDVPDGMEVSIYNGNGSSNKQPAAQ